MKSMRELIIARLEDQMNSCLEDGGCGLEIDRGEDFETFIDCVEQLEEMDDEQLLDFFEYCIGFQG